MTKFTIVLFVFALGMFAQTQPEVVSAPATEQVIAVPTVSAETMAPCPAPAAIRKARAKAAPVPELPVQKASVVLPPYVPEWLMSVVGALIALLCLTVAYLLGRVHAYPHPYPVIVQQPAPQPPPAPIIHQP